MADKGEAVPAMDTFGEDRRDVGSGYPWYRWGTCGDFLSKLVCETAVFRADGEHVGDR